MKNFDSLRNIFGGVLFRKEERHWFACSSEISGRRSEVA